MVSDMLTAKVSSHPDSTFNAKTGRGLAFCLGLGAFVFISAGGNISVLEVLAFLAFLLTFPRLRWSGLNGWFLAATAVLLAGLAISHLANADSGNELVKALANYGSLAVLSLVLANLFSLDVSGSIKSYFLAGAAISQLAGLILTPTPSSLIDPWKFGLGWAVNISVLLLLARSRPQLPRVSIAVAIALLAGVNLLLGSRSSAAILIVIALIVLLAPVLNSRVARATAVVVAALGLMLALTIYEFLAKSGSLGIAAALKYQNQSGDLGLLFGARKELVLLIGSWLDRPWIGWGPAGTVPFESRTPAIQWFVDHHYVLSASDYSRLFLVPDVPLHSVVFGILIQAGVLGLAFIVTALVLFARSLTALLPPRNFALLFVLLSATIHLFTSPLGDTTRLPIAVVFGLGLAVSIGARSTVDPPVTRRAGGRTRLGGDSSVQPT